jgi:hypothetical protein
MIGPKVRLTRREVSTCQELASGPLVLLMTLAEPSDVHAAPLRPTPFLAA